MAAIEAKVTHFLKSPLYRKIKRQMYRDLYSENWPPINEALQGCLTEEEVAAGAVAYDVDYHKVDLTKKEKD